MFQLIWLETSSLFPLCVNLPYELMTAEKDKWSSDGLSIPNTAMVRVVRIDC